MNKSQRLTPDDYYKNIYATSADDLVQRLAGLLDDIITNQDFIIESRSNMTDVARMYESIVAAVKFIAVYFSPVYLDTPMAFPIDTGQHAFPDDTIVMNRIQDIVALLPIAQFIAGAISMADHQEIHDDDHPPSDRAMSRSRQLWQRMQTVTSSLAMIEDTAREWLKQL